MSNLKQKINSATFIAKENNTIPKGSKIIKKTINVTVEEIQNGFLVVQNKELTLSLKNGNTDYVYLTSKVYSKNNPLNLDLEKFNKTPSNSLIDKL